MVYFPIRKCYQAVKITFLVVVVVTVLALFEQWRGGKRNARAMYSDPIEADYERQVLEDEARIIPGLGEGGVAAHLMGEEKRLGEESEKKLAINVYLSDRIPYNRTLKDYRNPACERVVYDAELPSASVIIIFHNEPYSVVLRTIWSVLNSARRNNPWYRHANYIQQKTGRVTNIGYPGQDASSPFVYLKEIILVDDNSTLIELKGKLDHYIRTRLPPEMIRVVRLPDRIGLTRARLSGARYATGDVLVFLDSHCEAQPDWLRPLLAAIKERPHAVVVPIIDVIETSTFYYSVGEISSFQVGGFTFMGHFTWTDVPDREKKRRGSDIAPTWSPTMAGGLFAISREYFWELGAYDEQMAGWGGENLEMSFRIWQCGGTLETIPCSRVGHVFRAFHPYGLPATTDTHGINTARMAEVWMDEYAELFYLHRPDLRNNPAIGDVTHRRVLREKLHCKSFQWYLDTVYREKFVPVRDVYGYGRFKNDATQLCLDTLQREGDKVPLGAYPCYPVLQATQYFSLSNRGELRDEVDCASVLHARIKPEERDKSLSRPVVMSVCHGKGRDQRWVRLSSGQLRHAPSALCLTAPRTLGDVHVTVCDTTDLKQIWSIDYNEDNDFKLNSEEELISAERGSRISKLRAHRSNRISRSLLSYTQDNKLYDTSASDNSTVRRHTHKRKHHKRRGDKSRSKQTARGRTKNKFILRVERTLQNGTEQHLEVDVRCRHTRLYPNNTFVRDLVTILNENNIKVINNGRVFERNKVTQLGGPHQPYVLNKMDVATPPQPQPRPHEPPPTPKAGRAHKKGKISPEQQHQPLGDERQRAGYEEAVRVEPHPLGLNAGRGTGNHNKLIIDDFIEVTSKRTKQTGKHRKHKQGRHSPRPNSTPAAPPPSEPRPLHEYAQYGAPARSVMQRGEVDSHAMETPLLEETYDGSGGVGERHADALKYNTHKLKRVTQATPDVHLYHPRAPAGDEGADERRADYPSVIGDLLHDVGDVSSEPRPPAGTVTLREGSEGEERVPTDTDKYYTGDQSRSSERRYNHYESLNTSDEFTDDDEVRRSAPPAPVKLVVKSNLTFDLDNELFTWGNKADDIVKQLLGELTIPSNSTEASAGDSRATSVHMSRDTRTPSDSARHSSSSSESVGV